MANWKDDKGRYAWGTYNKTLSSLKNIYVVGGSGGGNDDYFNIPMAEMDLLRSKNYGTGIHFWWNGDNLNITINLIAITSDTSWHFIRNEYYRGTPGYDVYEFYANIQYQKKDGQWVKLGEYLINTVQALSPLYDRVGWDTKGSGYLWKTLTFSNIDFDNITKFSLGIHGDNAEVDTWVDFPIETLPQKPTLNRPWAIRKSSKWVSFTNGNKEMKSRKGTSFAKRVDQKIRKSGTWKAQGKVGS